MPRYRVIVAVSGTEIYSVEAKDEETAWNEWYDGDLVSSENDDYDVVDIEEEVE